MLQQLHGEHSQFFEFDELSVPWEDSVVSPPRALAPTPSAPAPLSLDESLDDTSTPNMPNTQSPSLSMQSLAWPGVASSQMAAVAAVDDMAMALQETVRVELSLLEKRSQHTNLQRRRAPRRGRGPSSSPATASPSAASPAPSLSTTPMSSSRAARRTPASSRATASNIVENCIGGMVAGLGGINNNNELLSGRVALTALAQLLKEDHSRTVSLLETHEKAATAAKKRLVRLATMNGELDMFAAREVSDARLDEQSASSKVERRKADVVVPMSRRGAAGLAAQGLETETVGFLRGDDVFAGGASPDSSTRRRAASSSSGVKGLSDVARRRAARKTRMHLVHARIASLIQDQLRAQRDAGRTAEESQADAEEKGDLEAEVKTLREQLSLATAERQEALSQLERERHDAEAAERFELDELQGQLDAEAQTAAVLRDHLSQACQINRNGLTKLRQAVQTHVTSFDSAFDWVRFEVQKQFAAIIVGEEDRVEAARESAQAQEQSTRRSFARAFEARIAELGEELAGRDSKIQSLEVKIEAMRKASVAAEVLLERIRGSQDS